MTTSFARPLNERYQLLEVLGKGASSVVYLARDLDAPENRRAIKVLKSRLPPEMSARLAGEYAVARTSDHPALVRIFDLDEARTGPREIARGSAFLVEEFVEGTFLHRGLPSTWSNRKKAAILWRILLDGASALESLHRLGLLHRDVKPANLALCEDRLRLCDLGLTTATSQGFSSGTAGFIGPEVITGSQDARSDLFGLAASIYWLATGCHPRSQPGAAPSQLLADTLYNDLVPIRDLAPWIPLGLSQILEQTLNRDPAQRPSDASQLLAWARRKTRLRPLWAPPEQEPSRRPLFPPRLTGREDSLAQFMETLGEVERTGPRIFLIAGPAGVGRHRFATEVLIQLKVGHVIQSPNAGRSPGHGSSGGDGLWTLAGNWNDLFQKITGKDPGHGLDHDAAGKAEFPSAGRQALAMASALSTMEAPSRKVLLVRDAHRPGVAEAIARLAALARPDLASTAILAVTSTEEASNRLRSPDIKVFSLAPLDEARSRILLESMVGAPLDRRFSSLLHRLAGGLPRRLVELLQTAWAATPPGKPVEQEILAQGFDRQALFERAIGEMTPDEREALAGLALLGSRPGEPVSFDHLWHVMEKTDLDACLARLRVHGFVDWTGRGHVCTQPVLADMALAALEHARKTAMEDRCLNLLDRLLEIGTERNHELAPATWAALGRLARSRHQGRTAFAALKRAADGFSDRGDSIQAAQTAEQALALRSDDEATARWAARLAARAGRYDQALALLERRPQGKRKRRFGKGAPAPSKDMVPLSPEALFERGEYLRRAGKRQEATAQFQEIVAVQPGNPAFTRKVQASLARTLLETGRTNEALVLTETAPGLDHDESSLAWLEARSMALFHAGRGGDALSVLSRAEAMARDLGSDERLARILGLAGMIQQETGDLGRAEDSYRKALSLVLASGDIHSRAIYEANLGSLLLDNGRPDSALNHLGSAASTLRSLGLEDHFAGVLYNLGTAWLRLGETTEAAREVDEGLSNVSTPMARAYLKMLQSEISLRLPTTESRPVLVGHETGQVQTWPARAVEPALEAVRLIEGLQTPTKLVYAWANLVLVATGGNEAVPRRNEAVEALHRASLGEDITVKATARHALFALLHQEGHHPEATGKPEGDLFFATADDFVADTFRLVADLERSGARELAWRLALRAGLCAPAPLRPRILETSSRICQALLEETNLSYRAGRQSDPEVSLLLDVTASFLSQGKKIISPILGKGAMDNDLQRSPDSVPQSDAVALKRLLEVTRRLAEERRLESLLSFVLDAVMDLTGAERGFLLLAHDEGLTVGAQRHMDAEATDSKTKWSHSIARQAMEDAAPVLTVDARDDARFAQAGSVMNLKLRSVLAVPLIARSKPVGTLYVDNRMRRGAFTQRDAEIALSFADQAAAAIQTARLLELAERRRQEIERLNEQLALRLERAQTHIQTLRTEVASARRALAQNHSYEHLVGRSPAMQEVFELIERVSATDLPVVILGESGTGKELVAKAIHARSLRSDGPFASENCGAVTESLLESLLFGHEKGAFTGASRRQKGLFEIAHQGTLFLDEVGEMSPAMQVKLLRILQDGTFRRVGGDKAISVNVRVLAASNRDLEALVAQGGFRQDLFYRLAVVVIRLPPLRERTEDIPLLVAHFIQHYAGPNRTVSVERDAMDAIMSYPWPGNVRQLENEIMRITALSPGPITLTDLSSSITARRIDETPDTLDVKTNVEALERRLIIKAMDRSGGNRSMASRLLGLSRYGLLKKLRRYGMDES